MRDLAASERLTALAVRFAEPDRDQADLATTFAVTLALHHVYSAMESYFERVAKEVDQSVPEWDRVKRLLQRLPDIQGRLVAGVDRPFQAFLDQMLERLEEA